MPIRWAMERAGGWGLKFSWVAAHVFCTGFLLVVDSDLRAWTLNLSWIAAVYWTLVIVTVVQYSFTAGSSPGYVVEAKQQDETFEERAKKSIESIVNRTSTGGGRFPLDFRRVSFGEEAKGGSGQLPVSDITPLLPPSSGGQGQVPFPPGGSSSRVNACNTALLYSQPSFPIAEGTRSGRCSYCREIQPFRTKHCHDCDKCVLRFDHHCAWMGTCVGQNNHRKFWWFILFQTVLVTWTAIIYISAMDTAGNENWWLHHVLALVTFLGLVVVLLFLLTLLFFHTYLVFTNQTTYEKTRRRRIFYLQNLPPGSTPFSKGCTGNIEAFCCTPSDSYPIYTLPEGRV